MTPLPFELAPRSVRRNLATPRLVEMALAAGEGSLTDRGAFAAYSGEFSGRLPNDKYFVREPSTEADIWWGKVNREMSPEAFEHLLAAIREHLGGKDLFVEESEVCADPAQRVTVRTVTERAWNALFAKCLFRTPKAGDIDEPDWHILHAPSLKPDPSLVPTESGAVIGVSFERKLVLIAGTGYAGEIKKSIFSILNFLLPRRDVFSMHCAANIGPEGDAALFFGLAGTGKTTLSADAGRALIGDDEHGWSDEGVFNLEGGCYAKTVRLTREGEPVIYDALRFGSILENVPLDEHTRVPDFESTEYTENTRAAYPLSHVPNRQFEGRGGHPTNIFFLTCDAFGVLPPISKLTPEQAMYHFLSGYTAKVAGTERGITEPKVTFSACFGAPFMPMHPMRYAELLRRRMEAHAAPVWLVNTGWTGGGYGVGKRISLLHTRALLNTALAGQLDAVEFREDPVFGLSVPVECPGVPGELLRPRETWTDVNAYDARANDLATRFRENFEAFADEASDAVRKAGPGG